MKTARQTCVEALTKVNRNGGFSNLVIDHVMEKNGLSQRDKGFCCAMFYGVLERKLTLDFVIQHYSKIPMKRISPQALELLRIALYQILYLDGVPDSAAVNESVELAKSLGCGYASGFINGVLRGFLRDGGKVEKLLPSREGNLNSHLSLSYSVPSWLVELWIADYGPERAEAILAAACGRPPLYLRANTTKVAPEELVQMLCAESITARQREDLPACLEAEETGEIDRSPCYQDGLFTVQDISSQLCAQALEAKAGMRVADFCAAPGGKSFTIAQTMENQGELLAFDLHPQKAELIAKGARRLGLSCITVGTGDAKTYREELGFFDRVLCDVPCSGLGVIRRKPEIRYKLLEELAALPEIQYKILETSSKYIKEGGRLVYSTCTLRLAENEEVSARFLKEHPEFIPAPLPAYFCRFTNGGQTHQVTLTPDMVGSDGFFMACFQRKG